MSQSTTTSGQTETKGIIPFRVRIYPPPDSGSYLLLEADTWTIGNSGYTMWGWNDERSHVWRELQSCMQRTEDALRAENGDDLRRFSTLQLGILVKDRFTAELRNAKVSAVPCDTFISIQPNNYYEWSSHYKRFVNDFRGMQPTLASRVKDLAAWIWSNATEENWSWDMFVPADGSGGTVTAPQYEVRE